MQLFMSISRKFSYYRFKKDRDYANKEGNYFFPTTLGMALVAGYEDMDFGFSFSRPELRASVLTIDCRWSGTWGLFVKGKRQKRKSFKK